MHRPGVELAISRSQVQRPNHYTTEPPWGGDDGGELTTVTILAARWRTARYCGTAVTCRQHIIVCYATVELETEEQSLREFSKT